MPTRSTTTNTLVASSATVHSSSAIVITPPETEAIVRTVPAPLPATIRIRAPERSAVGSGTEGVRVRSVASTSPFGEPVSSVDAAGAR